MCIVKAMSRLLRQRALSVNEWRALLCTLVRQRALSVDEWRELLCFSSEK